MLQVEHINKKYVTGNLTQQALDDVSLNLRDNEFVAILGPSGSGKTTFLNIIGGLDRYDSGDVIINGISTKKYTDRDWDSYRNHTIGFVFQSYNLIPHQTVLSNVELALTISGVGRTERRRRAKQALKKVGLSEHMYKKPNQLSGGQMQRVAIARALVNDPDILLADEPTGALDTETSVQVMDLLKEVAEDRLVVMVTHNPDLAEEYATRIVRIQDGKIQSDTDPYYPSEDEVSAPVHKKMGRASMSLPTAIGLSFNNLWSKKARTILTAVAGSIGIIGIALILSLSTGVNQYIEDIEEETLSEYPIQITSNGMDLTSMMAAAEVNVGTITGQTGTDNEINVVQMISNMLSSVNSNDLESLKTYLDSGQSAVKDYSKSIEYLYDVTPQIYRVTDEDPGYRQVNPDASFSSLGFGSLASGNSMMSSMMSMTSFSQLPEDANLYEDQYDVVAGRWPEGYNELVVVLTENGGLTDFTGYSLGLRDPEELDDMIQNFLEGEENGDAPEFGAFKYTDILGMQFKLVNAYQFYEYDDEFGVWTDKTDNESYMKEIVDDGEDMTIVGIVKPAEDATSAALTMGVNYPASLVTHLVQEAAQSDIVKDQLNHRNTNIFTGDPFGDDSGESAFDMEDLFELDDDALADMFAMDGLMDGMDMSSLMSGMDLGSLGGSLDMSGVFNFDGSSFDLSGMLNLGDISVPVDNMPELNLGNLTDTISVTMSEEDMEKMLSDLGEGYEKYTKDHKSVASASDLMADFYEYLMKKDGGQKVMREAIKDILKDSGDVITMKTSDDYESAMEQLVYELIDKYLKENGLEHKASASADANIDENAFLVFIQNCDKEEMNKLVNKYFTIDEDKIEVTEAQMTKLATDLENGYDEYAKKNKKTTTDSVIEGFRKYLNSSAGQSAMSASVSAMIDTSSLEKQITEAMQQYLTTAFSSMSAQMGEEIEQQMSSAMSSSMTSMMDGMTSSMMDQISDQISSGMNSSLNNMMSGLAFDMSDLMDFDIDADTFADAFNVDFDADDLTELLTSISGAQSATYESNLADLGYADFNSPYEIDIYPKDFEDKEKITDILDDYNEQMDDEGQEDKVIAYTDLVGTLMSSVTDIINLISYVLIAFVAISLVVSSIMIGVITYISVLERQKEIGILRAMGASKGNISTVFNAEAAIIGLAAGLIGIGLSLLILIPGNAFIHMMAGSNEINAVLHVAPAVGLILLSVVLTLIGGLIPARQAAHSDPVAALRNE